jgi:hypothetical protein
MIILVIAMLPALVFAILLLLVGRESPNQMFVLDMVNRMSLALRNSPVTRKSDAAA